MGNQILPQTLAVSYVQDQFERAAISYTPRSLSTDEAIPEVFYKPVKNWNIVQGCISQVRNQIKDLMGRAVVGQCREGNELEAAARGLASHILPLKGLVEMVPAGMHPQFDIVWGAASEIPWEVLEQSYLYCPECEQPVTAGGQGGCPAQYCPLHGKALQNGGGKLALIYHLTHLVRGQGRPAGTGNEFLFIEDPCGDLCSPAKDPNGRCRAHSQKLRSLIEQSGFRLNIMLPSMMTRDGVLTAMRNPGLAGIYYLGHGYLSKAQDEGCLMLADNPVWASEIAELCPSARFVFINACEGAATGANWSLEKRSSSIAEAFARGGGKVVIAPIFPVVNVQAAETAVTFFEQALTSASLSESLLAVRKKSYELYQQGQPDLSWFAYRYFGDPNKTLFPTRAAPAGTASAGKPAAPKSRLFDPEGRLNVDLFGFDVDALLLRAAKRRNSQNRRQVTLRDLIAGLLRKGDLTRFVLGRLAPPSDPDKLYERLSQPVETEAGQATDHSVEPVGPQARDEAPEAGGSDETKMRELLSRWVVRRKEEFKAEVLNVLERADVRAVGRRGDSALICEREILEELFAAKGGMPSDAGIPAGFHAALDETAQSSAVDDNGHIVLPDCNAGARKVIEIAHTLAQHRGVCPITNRLMLAGLLADKKGFAARVFRSVKVKPEHVFVLMLAATQEQSSRSFGLSPEACKKIVLPVVEEASRLAQHHGRTKVSEEDLFRAYCRMASPEFKRAMKQPPLAFDLDAMESIDPPESSSDETEQEGDPDTTGRLSISTDQGSVGGNVGEERPESQNERIDEQFEKQRAQRLKDLNSRDPAKRREAREWFREADRNRSAGTEVGGDVRPLSFDEPAWQVVQTAGRLARTEGHQVTRSAHVLVALAASEHAAQSPIPREIRNQMRSMIPSETHGSSSATRGFSANAVRILRAAVERASSEGRGKASVADLEAIVYSDGGEAARGMFEQIAGAMFPALSEAGPALHARGSGTLLQSLGRDLTDKARQGELPEIIGRDNEIDLAIQILCQQECANPLLIGEAGVGKTAIAEGIALRIARGQCPKRLAFMRIVEVSAGSLVADTVLRGQFERRIQDLLAEARESVILFIDEIHTLVGAGLASGGSLDVGNMLKSALAKGEIRLIGATTPSEFRSSIERDKALSRRFHPQTISPPSREATIRILSSRQAALEHHHGVTIGEESKVAATDLSDRYIVDKQWPAKARDLLDHACALAATERAATQGVPTVTAEHVAKVVSRLTRVPLERLTASEQNLLATLEERLRNRIIGQEAAIRAVANSIRRGRQGLANRNRPWGVFLFAGPPGVGKTELAKVLSDEVYDEQEGFIRFDMGDFTEPHSTSKLLGAPPSYIGYGEGAPLVERLRRRPYSLVLLDEIEHAHRDVLAVLLRLLSEGTIEDHEGNIGDARNCIIIMTTNAIDPTQTERMGFAARDGDGVPADLELRSMLQRMLPSKLVDRVDEIVCFRALERNDLEAIASMQAIEIINTVAAERRIHIDLSPEVIPWLAEKAAVENTGARGIHRVLNACVGTPLGTFLTRTVLAPGAQVQIFLKDGELRVSSIGP